MTEPFETTYILFADMLGFAALVESEGDELNELSPVFTGVELYPSSAESLLGYRFINSHRCLNEARVRIQKLGTGTAIVFSDSAFLRIDGLEQANSRHSQSHSKRNTLLSAPAQSSPQRAAYRRHRRDPFKGVAPVRLFPRAKRSVKPHRFAPSFLEMPLLNRAPSIAVTGTC